MNRFVEAKAINFKTIQVLIYNPNKENKYIFTLVIDSVERIKLNERIIEKKEKYTLYEIKLKEDLELGYDYHIAITDLGTYSLNINYLSLLPEFDQKFYYDGDDLGVKVSKNKTEFAIWAPLASAVILVLDGVKTYLLPRDNKGVYRKVFNKNLENHTYNYLITNSSVTTLTLDPYGKASTPNSKSNVILNLNNIKMNMYDYKLPKMNSPLDAIIYEGSVRDLTIDPNTDISFKGKFLGLVEEGRKNKDGLPVGFDYIKSLGITHLQLLPIYDFASTDEINPSKSYNWGYDPSQYFIPEGSYASDPYDPKSRIHDLLTLISKYHKAGIRIVMDVVYNHCYEHLYSSFEAVVPNYYFRRLKDGNFFNASGCGNDFAFERKMVDKYFLDVSKFWINFYHIDGFRFDLMGLINVDTLNKIKIEAKKVKKDFILYGEGWDMYSGYNQILGNSNNHLKMPCYAFFNDSYRDVIIGNLYDRNVGFGMDNIVFRDSFKEVATGSCFKFKYEPRFNDMTRSINFVECHDNNTLYDKINILRKSDKEEDKLKRIVFINKLVLYSIGIPFIHAGQEIGLSKKGVENSYNAGDEINMFNYSLLKNRMFMVNEFKDAIKVRKDIKLFHELNKDKINKNADLIDIDNGGVLFKFKSDYKDSKNVNIGIFINPSFLPLNYNEENDRIFKGEVKVNPIDIKIVYEK